jgi:peroxiredoxin
MKFLLTWLETRRGWMIVTLLILGLGTGWIWISAAPAAATTSGQIPSPREGFAAPDFSLELLGGAEITLSELKGKVVVVNLWASWCPPCRAEMPALQSAYQADRHRGLEIVAINTTFQDGEIDAQQFANSLGLTFPIALDRTGTVSRQYLLRALPSTFFIGRDGVIRKVIIGGPMSEATIRSTVEELLGEVD